jgi:hypothetical protein
MLLGAAPWAAAKPLVVVRCELPNDFGRAGAGKVEDSAAATAIKSLKLHFLLFQWKTAAELLQGEQPAAELILRVVKVPRNGGFECDLELARRLGPNLAQAPLETIESVSTPPVYAAEDRFDPMNFNELERRLLDRVRVCLGDSAGWEKLQQEMLQAVPLGDFQVAIVPGASRALRVAIDPDEVFAEDNQSILQIIGNGWWILLKKKIDRWEPKPSAIEVALDSASEERALDPVNGPAMLANWLAAPVTVYMKTYVKSARPVRIVRHS